MASKDEPYESPSHAGHGTTTGERCIDTNSDSASRLPELYLQSRTEHLSESQRQGSMRSVQESCHNSRRHRTGDSVEHRADVVLLSDSEQLYENRLTNVSRSGQSVSRGESHACSVAAGSTSAQESCVLERDRASVQSGHVEPGSSGQSSSHSSAGEEVCTCKRMRNTCGHCGRFFFEPIPVLSSAQEQSRIFSFKSAMSPSSRDGFSMAVRTADGLCRSDCMDSGGKVGCVSEGASSSSNICQLGKRYTLRRGVLPHHESNGPDQDCSGHNDSSSLAAATVSSRSHAEGSRPTSASRDSVIADLSDQLVSITAVQSACARAWSRMTDALDDHGASPDLIRSLHAHFVTAANMGARNLSVNDLVSSQTSASQPYRTAESIGDSPFSSQLPSSGVDGATFPRSSTEEADTAQRSEPPEAVHTVGTETEMGRLQPDSTLPDVETSPSPSSGTVHSGSSNMTPDQAFRLRPFRVDASSSTTPPVLGTCRRNPECDVYSSRTNEQSSPSAFSFANVQSLPQRSNIESLSRNFDASSSSDAPSSSAQSVRDMAAHISRDARQSSPSCDERASNGGMVLTFGSTLRSCAICFEEYAPGDQIRILNPCNHGYHVHCIDLWFSSPGESCCPVCKASIQTERASFLLHRRANEAPIASAHSLARPRSMLHLPTTSSSAFLPQARALAPAAFASTPSTPRVIGQAHHGSVFRSSNSGEPRHDDSTHSHMSDVTRDRLWPVELIDYSVEVGWGDWVRSFLSAPSR